MDLAIRVLGAGDDEILARAADGVFDYRIDPGFASEFLNDPRHHLAVALDGNEIIGFASAVHYLHPDKPPELWINEVGVAPTHQGRGIGKRLLLALFDVGRSLNCGAAWVLTDRSNGRAIGLYSGLGGHPSDHVMFNFEFSA
jgi:aminoglycoside 6'-N-acetyltransferase I